MQGLAAGRAAGAVACSPGLARHRCCCLSQNCSRSSVVVECPVLWTPPAPYWALLPPPPPLEGSPPALPPARTAAGPDAEAQK